MGGSGINWQTTFAININFYLSLALATVLGYSEYCQRYSDILKLKNLKKEKFRNFCSLFECCSSSEALTSSSKSAVLFNMLYPDNCLATLLGLSFLLVFFSNLDHAVAGSHRCNKTIIFQAVFGTNPKLPDLGFYTATVLVTELCFLFLTSY